MSHHVLIAYHQIPTLGVVNADALELTAQLDTPGRVAVLGVSGHGRYGFAVHRDDHCVSIVDARDLSRLRVVPTEQQPTHFHAHGHHVVIFNDGSGSVCLFDEREMTYPPRIIPVAQPDHGSAVVIDGYLLAGHLRLGRVDLYHIEQGVFIAQWDCCPILHGAAQIGEVALFGCSDGVLLIKKRAGQFDAVKLSYPDDAPAQARVGLWATHPNAPFALGNFGEGLMLIHPAQESSQAIRLGAHPLKFAFDTTGTSAYVLTHDGVLSELKMPNGEIIRSMALCDAVERPRGPDGKARPTFALNEDKLWVAEPKAQQLIALSLMDWRIEAKIGLPHPPLGLVCL